MSCRQGWRCCVAPRSRQEPAPQQGFYTMGGRSLILQSKRRHPRPEVSGERMPPFWPGDCHLHSNPGQPSPPSGSDHRLATNKPEWILEST
jgi:hypothetical protein